jgi:hypothetical protein
MFVVVGFARRSGAGQPPCSRFPNLVCLFLRRGVERWDVSGFKLPRMGMIEQAVEEKIFYTFPREA